MTIGEALREGERRLQAAGIDTARLDAELLLRHVGDWDRARLLVAAGEPLAPGDAERYFGLVSARASRRPLQHLTGRQAFWRHEFEVSPAVLIPRPETELLVEAALAELAPTAAPLVADVGTGSGCIALAIAAERPDARLVATDVSAEALDVARRNAKRLGLDTRVDFRGGDLLEPLAVERGTLDAVVSNPPYVDPAQRAALAPEVRDHEPALALFAEDRGYAVYRRLIPAAREALRAQGLLGLEVGFGQSGEVVRLARDAGFDVRAVIPDLQGIPRVVIARSPR